MAFPQTKTPLSPTVRKRQRRINSSAVPLLLPVQSPAPQCASNNARPVITGACRSRLLGRRCRPFSRKARRGSSHGRPALPCTIRQLSAAFFPGTLSRHSRIFHCPGVYSHGGWKSRDTDCLLFHLVHIKSEHGSCTALPWAALPTKRKPSSQEKFLSCADGFSGTGSDRPLCRKMINREVLPELLAVQVR